MHAVMLLIETADFSAFKKVWNGAILTAEVPSANEQRIPNGADLNANLCNNNKEMFISLS